MKQKFKTVIFFCLVFTWMMACASDSKTSQKKLQWYTLAEGTKIAGETGRKMFLYFRADW